MSSASDLVDGDVALVAYGDHGNSGPIILGAPPGKLIFQGGNEDEFRVGTRCIVARLSVDPTVLPLYHKYWCVFIVVNVFSETISHYVESGPFRVV